MKQQQISLIMSLFIILLVVTFVVQNYLKTNSTATQTPEKIEEKTIIAGSFDESKSKTNEEWKQLLTPEQYYILREEGTETPFTGELLDNKEKGVYVSAGCDIPVFSSDAKYDSKTGWPSFYEAINEDAVVLREDNSLGYKRIEVLDKCGGHLGHVFDDGPEPTGKRFCINSDALIFIPAES